MKLYHISEEPAIETFIPRPSPSNYEKIEGNVVFAISDKMLHNYLLPRDCPRVTYYAKEDSLKSDIEKFIGDTVHNNVIVIEGSWLERVKNATLFRFELPAESFTLLDESAGYYISYKAVKPLSVEPICDLLAELAKRDVELRVTTSLHLLAEEISGSSLQFSIIRMRNAAK